MEKKNSKKNLYLFDKSLTKLSNFHPPFNRFIASTAKLFMPNIPFILKKYQVPYSQIPLKDKYKFKTYIVYPDTNINKDRKCYLYLHGGGFAYKANPSQINGFIKIIKKLDLIGIIIDYSVLKPYPIPNNEILMSFDYIYENSSKYHILKEHIFLAGDSAGGYLATDLTIKCHQKIKALLLYFPVLDNTLSSKSMKLFNDTPLWNSKNNQKMWKIYLGNNKIQSLINLDNYSYFPPTYIEACEYDCLRDEAIILKDKLLENKCDVTYYFIEGTMHGYDILITCDLTKTSIKNRIDFIKNR